MRGVVIPYFPITAAERGRNARVDAKGLSVLHGQSQHERGRASFNPFFRNNTAGVPMRSKKVTIITRLQSQVRFWQSPGREEGPNAVTDGDGFQRTFSGISGGLRWGIVGARSSGEFGNPEETILAIPGVGLNFTWTRTYRSRTGPTTAQGAGWDFPSTSALTPNGDGTVTLRPGSGRADTFYPNGTNGWTRDEYFLVIRDVDQDGSPDVVVFSRRREVDAASPSTSLAGKLAQIVDRNHNTIPLRIRHGHRAACAWWTPWTAPTRSPTLPTAWLNRSPISPGAPCVMNTIALPTCRVHLPAVIGTPNGNDFPGGKTNRYAYSGGNLDQRLNHNLVAITDPKGQVCFGSHYHIRIIPRRAGLRRRQQPAARR